MMPLKAQAASIVAPLPAAARGAPLLQAMIAPRGLAPLLMDPPAPASSAAAADSQSAAGHGKAAKDAAATVSAWLALIGVTAGSGDERHERIMGGLLGFALKPEALEAISALAQLGHMAVIAAFAEKAKYLVALRRAYGLLVAEAPPVLNSQQQQEVRKHTQQLATAEGRLVSAARTAKSRAEREQKDRSWQLKRQQQQQTQRRETGGRPVGGGAAVALSGEGSRGVSEGVVGAGAHMAEAASAQASKQGQLQREAEAAVAMAPAAAASAGTAVACGRGQQDGIGQCAICQELISATDGATATHFYAKCGQHPKPLLMHIGCLPAAALAAAKRANHWWVGQPLPEGLLQLACPKPTCSGLLQLLDRVPANGKWVPVLNLQDPQLTALLKMYAAARAGGEGAQRAAGAVGGGARAQPAAEQVADVPHAAAAGAREVMARAGAARALAGVGAEAAGPVGAQVAAPAQHRRRGGGAGARRPAEAAAAAHRQQGGRDADAQLPGAGGAAPQHRQGGRGAGALVREDAAGLGPAEKAASSSPKPAIGTIKVLRRRGQCAEEAVSSSGVPAGGAGGAGDAAGGACAADRSWCGEEGVDAWGGAEESEEQEAEWRAREAVSIWCLVVR